MRAGLLVLFLIAANACGSPSRGPKTPSAKERPANQAWRYVPKDTIAIYATTAPVWDVPWWPSHPKSGFAALAKRVAELEAQGVDARKQLPDFHREVLRVLKHLSAGGTSISKEQLVNLGFGAESRLVAYALRLNAVLRLEIEDANAVDSTIESLFSELAFPATRVEHEGHGHWRVARDDWELHVVVREQELVVGVDWTGEREQFVAQLLGPPRDEIDAGGMTKNISESIDLGAYFMRFSLPALAEAGFDWFRESEGRAPSPACTEEVKWLASGLPTLWTVGDESRGAIFAELPESQVRALRRMVRPVPSLVLPAADHLLMHVAMGIDTGLAIGYLRSALDEVSRRTFRCEELKDLPRQMGQARNVVQGMGATPLAGLTGVALAFLQRAGDPAGEFNPKVIAALTHATPSSVLNVLRLVPGAVVPMGLKVGDAPKRLRIPGMEQLAPLLVTLGESIVAVGWGLSEELVATAKAKANAKSTPQLLEVQMNVRRLMALDDGEERKFTPGVYDEGIQDALDSIDSTAIELDDFHLRTTITDQGILGEYGSKRADEGP